jgi:hypothetical protein
MTDVFTKECVQCHGRFTAKRDTAKYCSGRCRQRAHAAKDMPAPPPERREAAPLVALPPKEPNENGILAVTLRELRAADRLDTPMGQATVLIARILDSGIQDTGSSIAALIRQYDASLSKALDGARTVESPLERVRRERELRVG